MIGFPPGHAIAMVARLLADRLAPLLGEIDNRQGQRGSILKASGVTIE